MKIGIVTFHFPHNYGAMLQAYAMQEKLCSMGYDSYIIDYEPEYHKSWYPRGLSLKQCFVPSVTKTIKYLAGYVLRNPSSNIRYDGFEAFKNNRMKLYPYNPNSNYSEFDAILLGSDQIWDMQHTDNRFDGPYYGEDFSCKVFSYAASSKYKKLSEFQQKEFKTKLESLSFVGVREVTLQKLLQPLTDKQVYVNLDPSLIADSSVYDKLNLSKPIKGKYVLIYELNEHPEVLQMARRYARRKGARVVSLRAYFNWRKRTPLYDQKASPEKFLAYIKNAECVFTSSFHGTAFSLIFQKEFFTIRQNNNSDLRMESLLQQLGLSGRFINMNESPNQSEIDFASVKEKLVELRESSEGYLRMALGDNN